MDRIDTIEVPRTLPRPAATADIAAVLDAICSPRPRKDVPLGVLRDRVLFETAYVCGARASESAECTSKTWTCARTTSTRLHGKGGTVRTVLLDDRGYLALLRLYLARSSYTSGPQFRASVNGRGGPVRQRPGRPAVLRRGAQPVEEILRRRRHWDRHPPAPPRARQRAFNSGVSIEVVRPAQGGCSPHPARTGASCPRDPSRGQFVVPAPRCRTARDLFTLPSQSAIRRLPDGSVIPSAGQV